VRVVDWEEDWVEVVVDWVVVAAGVMAGEVEGCEVEYRQHGEGLW
jgi:hypothetical protein